MIVQMACNNILLKFFGDRLLREIWSLGNFVTVTEFLSFLSYMIQVLVQ